MTGEQASHRRVIEVTGGDRAKFLQGLVTNDTNRLAEGLVYTALLTPQGKYLADFFMLSDGDRILLDCAATQAEDLMKRLTLYKLRADVGLALTDLHVQRGLGTPPDGAFPDPRHASLGWRRISEDEGAAPEIDWDAIRVEHCIPQAGIELIPNDSFVLEVGLDRLNGVDFRKGCYVGQEVTARMKHKTELRKGLARVNVTGSAPVGTDITSGGKVAGTLYTQSGGHGIAYLRFDRANEDMAADGATVGYPAP